MFHFATDIDELTEQVRLLRLQVERVADHLDHLIGLPTKDGPEPSVSFMDDDNAPPEEEH